MTSWRVRYEPFFTPVFRAWWRMRRSMTLGVRGIAFDGTGRVLLVRHTYAKGWHFPGGGVEHGETALDALAREMAEEGGVGVEGAPELVGVYSNHAVFPNDHILLYRIRDWRPCAPSGGHEIAERGFFAPGALPADATPGTLRRMAEVFDGAEVSARW